MGSPSPLRARRHAVSPAFIARLESGLMIAARAVEHDIAALPIFERVDAELQAARAHIEVRAMDCPVERARALLKVAAR